MKSTKVALCIVIVITAFIPECYGDTVNVTGQLFCEGSPAANVKVELREYDKIDPIDTIATVNSDYFGIFNLHGDETEMGKVQFYIRIQHNCDAKEKCSRLTSYSIPNRKYDTFYDLGPINLKPYTWREEDQC
ncbi:transthyretin-like family domain-containing protein [Ditylenchus destructor]|uniref:Transthyretin-like family domain-containing protein n=1 Tax=Ditylenchus destructor TaxID=166010 RepID=A0AAD4MP41_9BILA|nr:transthyretin-like family domain-containing protein [Ditylenchus destructor]